MDFDDLSRDVVTVGVKMVTGGFETGFHSHRKAQFVMAVSGVLTCEAEGGIWIVPPQTAIWIPPGVEHCISFAGNWARRVAMSERSLARLIVAETGMSSGRWRQQLNIILALQWMAKGTSVRQVASALGYESVGSFVTMFRKALGTSPGRSISGRLS